MRKILYTLAFALTMIGTAQAQNKSSEMNCDSTCLGGSIGTMTTQQAKAQTVYASNTSQMAPVTSTQSVRNMMASCPAGFTYQGSAYYPKSQVITVTYYRNGQVVGTQTMPEKDLDNDCTATQYQTLQCPAGQTGLINQQRTVSTGDSGLEYSAWQTTSNTCQSSSGVWVSLGWQYGKGNPSPYPQCNYMTLRPGGTCTPKGYRCAFDDDRTTKVATYECQ
ncbi:hypothetical protein LP085_08055 [Achromobacter sp. MY14]|uniref:hypothetical protein n=1 Tax=unclassified Achromobacter TaxID=2626865 RepID=UPI001E490080|nr:hypothetical protein [Achromobacter sp. MY14]MCD0496799.1 hypothetical protein [Achromobacter sp. MY14]